MTTIEYLKIPAGKELPLPARGALSDAVHVFEQSSILAINTALAARRPLLIRGEPGIGKSQLAHAAAVGLKRVFLPKVIDARTESRDLFYAFDAVARLAEAQLQGALCHPEEDQVRARLDEKRFLKPGPLWWAFDWVSAQTQAEFVGAEVPKRPKGPSTKVGTVVLLDEIDKADASVPNGLLEALGNGEFSVPGSGTVGVKGIPPLVVVTTNEERALPDAFLRRCMVLHLRVDEGKDKLIPWLMERGLAHFRSCAESVRREAAEQLFKDRDTMQRRGLAAPGQAEYLDLLRAVLELAKDEAGQCAKLKEISPFALEKHPDEVLK